jgi:hypothetical protein
LLPSVDRAEKGERRQHEREQAALAEIVALRTSGLSLEAIRDAMRKQGSAKKIGLEYPQPAGSGSSGMSRAKQLTMRRAVAVIALCFQYAAASASAQEGLTRQGPEIQGGSNCGDWLEARQNKTAVVLESYVLGMLNGLATGRFVEFWRADGREISWRAAYFLVD